jgi:F-type H+-transporting ATPase subunit delta
MNTNRVTVRYARALFDIALEEKKAEAINKDMQLIEESSNSPEFKAFLENPVIFPSKKQTVFNQVFKNYVDDLSLRFFKLLTEHKREIYLKSIAVNYRALFREHNGIKSVQLTTAFETDENLNKEISDIISREFKTKVELSQTTDKNILGGFILTVENLQFDAGVATKLKDIKNELLKA